MLSAYFSTSIYIGDRAFKQVTKKAEHLRTFGGRRKAVRDRLALQGGTGDFP